MTFTTHNKTPFEAKAMFLKDKDGVKHAVTLIKATWNFSQDGAVTPSDEQMPLQLGDEYWGEPGTSSIRYASDIVFEKKGTDIALNGHAYASGGIKVTETDVLLKVGAVMKIIHVTGDRFWAWRAGIITKTRPVPFEKIPLCYERAFGGKDPCQPEGTIHGICGENPVGTGFRVTRSQKAIDGHPLPNLEDRKKRIKRWTDKPTPVGFGFIAPSWTPRAGFFGTCDDSWRKNRMPLLPEDHDTRFNNAAAPDLVSEGFLTGNEEVLLRNVHPSGKPIDFSLPGITVKTAYIFKHQTFVPRPELYTLLIEPDMNRFSMVWCSSFSGSLPLTQLKQVTIDYE